MPFPLGALQITPPLLRLKSLNRTVEVAVVATAALRLHAHAVRGAESGAVDPYGEGASGDNLDRFDTIILG